MDVLAISMVELAKSRTELFMEETRANIQFQSIPLKSLEETITPKAISHAQSELEIEQYPNVKEMSIEKLMAQDKKEEQQRSFPSILKVKSEKQDVDNKEVITLTNGGELKELKRERVDADELKELVTKEEEDSNSLEPNEMRKEVVETLWGEMHEELQMRK